MFQQKSTSVVYLGWKFSQTNKTLNIFQPILKPRKMPTSTVYLEEYLLTKQNLGLQISVCCHQTSVMWSQVSAALFGA